MGIGQGNKMNDDIIRIQLTLWHEELSVIERLLRVLEQEKQEAHYQAELAYLEKRKQQAIDEIRSFESVSITSVSRRR